LVDYVETCERKNGGDGKRKKERQRATTTTTTTTVATMATGMKAGNAHPKP
jgi:hypothetical protein